MTNTAETSTESTSTIGTPSNTTLGSAAASSEAGVTTPGQVQTGTPETKISWVDTLPDDLKNEAMLQTLRNKDISDMVRQYVVTQKEMGSRIRIPGPDASPEAKAEFIKKLESVQGVTKLPDPNNQTEVDSFYSKLGVPAKADGYNVTLPEGTPVDEKIMNDFKGLAHQLKLNNAQVNGVIKFQTELERQQAETISTNRNNTVAVLKEVWGNEYDNRLKLAASTAQHFKTQFPEAVKQLLESPAGDNPVVLAMAAELGKVYKEAGLIKGEALTNEGLTAEEARARIAEIKANPGHPANPLFKGKMPERERQAELEKAKQLYTMAYPDTRQSE